MMSASANASVVDVLGGQRGGEKSGETLLPVLDPSATAKALLDDSRFDEDEEDDVYMEIVDEDGFSDHSISEAESDFEMCKEDDDAVEEEDEDLDGAEMVIEDPFEEVPSLPAAEGGVKIEALSLDNILPTSRRCRFQQMTG